MSTFSIPNRIEPSATETDDPRVGAHPSAFSIPNRIEPSATLRLRRRGRTSILFQYPQSDRALCNLRAVFTTASDCTSFSIPNRIEPSATGGTAGSCSAFPSFSIPNRIEPSATELNASIGLPQEPFSIPNRIEPSATRISEISKLLDILCFQYPQSDRALCNRRALM